MTAKVINLQQANTTHQIAITGLSCRIATAQNQLLDIQSFWQSLVDKNQINPGAINIENSLLLQLSKEALADANINMDSSVNQHISLIVNDCRMDQSNIDISQLVRSLDPSNNNQDSHQFTKSFGQGLSTVVEQIQSKQVENVLLIVIDRQSAAALVFRLKEKAVEQKEHIYACPVFIDCYSLMISASDDQSVIVPLITTILSLDQKVIPPSSQLNLESKGQAANSLKPPVYINKTVRPWFHPQIHKQLAQLNPNLTEKIDSSDLRRAEFNFLGSDGNSYHLLLEEAPDLNEAKSQDFKTNWESEVFAFYAADKQGLFNYVQTVKRYLSENTISHLKDLAFTINSWSSQQINKVLTGARKPSPQTKHPIRAAFVSTSLEDIHSKLDQLTQYCLNAKVTDDLYWNDHSLTGNEIAQGKLAFILPGLGAAYPDMLTELCLHFPEVRAIFDFVDYLAVSAGSRLKPSERIFPYRDQYAKPSAESPATLAMMDSAVITVLMAEWAIFTLLLNLGITPDILLGCSTGEFAALTMSGAIDILSAAPLFYHLSTGISKALPFNRLVNLRSLKINAAFVDIEKHLVPYQGKVHISADLSDKQLLVTGDKDSINALTKILEDNNISADFLPFAIPYHTSLVADIVSPQDPDVLALQISEPLIESWSCSLVDKYPSNPDLIRKISTELFSKPILFRNSIEALYAKGVRKFVEVGPRGNLAPIISETLKSSPHISIAANRADLSSVTQLNHTLAALFVNDVYMDFSYLYRRRSPVFLPTFENLTDTAPTYQPHHLPSIEDFRKQLLQLERQTIAALQSNKSNITDSYLSEEISLPQIFSQFTHESFSDIVCQQILEDKLPSDNNLIRQQAESALLASEIETFQSFQQLPKRRQWLAGRIAIKEAVRALLLQKYNAVLANSDIEIGIEQSGKIFIKTIQANYPCPVISLTHKNDRVIAVAADSTIYSAIGIDLESVDPVDDDLAKLVFSEEEQKYIENMPHEKQHLNFKKIWAAKEAAAKVLGLGLPDYLKNLSIIDINKDMNHFSIDAPLKQGNRATGTARSHSTTSTVETASLKMSAYVAGLQDMVLAVSFLPIL